MRGSRSLGSSRVARGWWSSSTRSWRPRGGCGRGRPVGVGSRPAGWSCRSPSARSRGRSASMTSRTSARTPPARRSARCRTHRQHRPHGSSRSATGARTSARSSERWRGSVTVWTVSWGETRALRGRSISTRPRPRGTVAGRVDSGFYSAELMSALRKQQVRFSMSAPRTSSMWRALAEIPEHDWVDAIEMRGAQVAETQFTPHGWAPEPLRLIVRRASVPAAETHRGSPRARRRSTIPPQQLQMVLDGQLDSTYAYSFIVTDIPTDQKSMVEAEHFHRHRAQIEERFKDAKLGQPLRHLPSGDLNANRVWLTANLTALNITAILCDLSPAAAASGQAPDHDTPLRRHGKALRRILFCVPARVIRTARQITLRLPAGFRYLDTFQQTYDNVYALG